MSKHTAGPWVSDKEGWIESESGEVVCEYAGCGTHEAKWGKGSNLDLVLAAPDLLDALEYMLETNVSLDGVGDEARQQASSAIAKARGEMSKINAEMKGQ